MRLCKKDLVFSYVNFASRVMSEGVGACILSWGEHRAAIGDAAEVEDFLERIGAKLDKNSLNNGCEFPTSSQVLREVLLPFFKKKYSEHLLIGIFHGDKDGSWMLGGNTRLCFRDVANVWEEAKKTFGACSHLTIVVDSCHSGWWAEHAAQYGCPSISVQTACGTGYWCETLDDPDGFSFTSIWVDKQKEQRQLLQLNAADLLTYRDNERMVKEGGACYWCAHIAEWAYIGKPLPMLLDGDHKPKRTSLIVCDGNIGCGKTTFLNEIGRSQHFEIFREPVAKHAEDSWWSLLEKFYHDMKNGQGTRAVIDLKNAIWEHHSKIATQRKSHAITERCCDSSVRVFCKTLRETGTLPEGEFKRFMKELDRINANVGNTPTLILHFRLTVQEAMRRIKKRAEDEGRKFEEGIEEAYLNKLDRKYEELYKDRDDVITLDSSMPTERMKRKVVDELENNQTKYRRVLEGKGHSRAEAHQLLIDMTNCFKPKTA